MRLFVSKKGNEFKDDFGICEKGAKVMENMKKRKGGEGGLLPTSGSKADIRM